VPVLKGTGSFSTTFFFGASFFTTGSGLTSSVTSGAFFFLDLVFLASAGAAAGASLAFSGAASFLAGAGADAFLGAGAFFSFLALGCYSVLSIQVS